MEIVMSIAYQMRSGGNLDARQCSKKVQSTPLIGWLQLPRILADLNYVPSTWRQ